VGFGVSWQEAFATRSREHLSQLLASEGIDAVWHEDGTLTTTRHRPGVVRHPLTGEECWFNQLTFLNGKALEPAERSALRRAFNGELPVETFHGDGSALSNEDWTAILSAYDATTSHVNWRTGDLLVRDNVLMAHGSPGFREPPEFIETFGKGPNGN
jgi:hypothetical protein